MRDGLFKAMERLSGSVLLRRRVRGEEIDGDCDLVTETLVRGSTLFRTE